MALTDSLQGVRKLVGSGRMDEAFDTLEGLVERLPDELEPLFLLAELLEGIEAWDRALAVVDHARSLASEAAAFARLDALGATIQDEAVVRLHERVDASRRGETAVSSLEIMRLSTAALGEAIVLAEPASDALGRWLLRSLRTSYRLEIHEGHLQITDMRRGVVRPLELSAPEADPPKEGSAGTEVVELGLDRSVLEALANLDGSEAVSKPVEAVSKPVEAMATPVAAMATPVAAMATPVAAVATPVVAEVDVEEAWRVFDEACELVDGEAFEEARSLLLGIRAVAGEDETLLAEVETLLGRFPEEEDPSPVASAEAPEGEAASEVEGGSPEKAASPAIPRTSLARVALERARSYVQLMSSREGREFEELGKEARASFQEALKQDPDLEAIVTYELACLHHQKLRKLDEAVRLYCRFLELAAPGDPLAAMARERLDKLQPLV